MVKIKKLTPPQITALREVLPSSVLAGYLTTTASVATFHDVPGREPWQTEHVAKLLGAKAVEADCRPLLNKVLDKINTRPDLVEVA